MEGNEYRVDPRLKLAHIMIISIMTMIINSDFVYLIHIISISITLMYLNNILSGVKFFFVFVGYRLFLVTANYLPEITLLIVLEYLIYVFIKLHPFIAIGVIATKTMTTSDLLGAFRKFRLPKNFILPFAVTQRFIPTFINELRSIQDSMKMRGIGLSFLGVIKSPLKTLEYIFVPLLMRSVKISDELSASAVVRGIENPKNRTSMYDVRLRRADYFYLVFMSLCNLSIIILNK